MVNRREKDKRESRKTNALAWAKEAGRRESTSVKLPEGVEWYKLEPGQHQIDFMPYVVGKGNPNADEGFQHFERTFFIHRIPGPNGVRPYCCSWNNFGKKCPVCAWLNTNANTADKELVRQLKASKRHLWVVNDKPGKEKNALKVLETNHFNRGFGFGEMMVDAITSVPKYASFSDLVGGWTVQLTVKEQSFPGGKYNGVTRIDFLPREHEYSDEMLERAPCLDELLVHADYDELQKLLDMGESNGSNKGDDDEKPERTSSVSKEDEDEDEEDEKPKAKKQVKEDEDDDDKEPTAESFGLKVGDLVTYKGDECEIKKISGDGTSLTLEDEDGTTYRAVGPDDVKKVVTKQDEDEDEDEEDEKPKAKKRVKDDEEEDDDEEEEDDDDEPKAKKAKKSKVDDDDDDDDEPLEEEDDKEEEEDDDEEEEEDDEDEPKAKRVKKKR